MTASIPPRSGAPWIVGREPLLEHAAEEFLNEVTRQQPWKRARAEALLEELGEFLQPHGPAPLSALTAGSGAAWLRRQGDPAAAPLLADFQRYLRDFGWWAD